MGQFFTDGLTVYPKMAGESHMEFSGMLDGTRVRLHLGGEDDGWFVDDDTGDRIRKATDAELDATRRFYWDA